MKSFICIRVCEKVADWENVEAKKFNRVGDIHYTSLLRDPYASMKVGGEDEVVSVADSTPFQVGR